jgi:alanine racemase
VGEGIALRALVKDVTIFVLSALLPDALEACFAHDLVPVLNSMQDVKAWTQAKGDIAVLHVDTGMNRLGIRAEEVDQLPAELNVGLVLSHLATADEPSGPTLGQQVTAFSTLRQRFPRETRFSLCNSAGCFVLQSQPGDIRRPGIARYGGASLADKTTTLPSAITLEAPILMTRVVPVGEAVGYGALWRPQEPKTIAIISCGYADGFPRAVSPFGRGPYRVNINGYPCPLAGRISMDLLAVDVTEMPAPPQAGDTAILLGEGDQLNDLATMADTIAYEILTRLGPRFERKVVVG